MLMIFKVVQRSQVLYLDTACSNLQCNSEVWISIQCTVGADNTVQKYLPNMNASAVVRTGIQAVNLCFSNIQLT